MAVGEIDPLILLEFGIHRDVQQAALSLVEDGRRALDRIGQEPSGQELANGSGPFGDECLLRSREANAPRNIEILRQHFNSDLVVEREDAFRRVRFGGSRGFFSRENVVDEIVDLIIGERGVKGGHREVGDAVLDVPKEMTLFGAELPDGVDQTLGIAAFHLFAMARRAVIPEERCGFGSRLSDQRKGTEENGGQE